MYGHVELHPSQQISDPPIIKRNLVRNIVAQFNEEAIKRNRNKNKKAAFFSNEDLHYNSRVPLLSDPDDDTGPNNNVPFSYTSAMPYKSKSEYNLKSPNEVIYAQVVVNGQGGRGKSTIHTKVPVQQNGVSRKYNTIYSNGMSKTNSVSMGNLQTNRYYNKLNDTNYVNHSSRPASKKYVTNEYQYNERSRSESPTISDTTKQTKSKSRKLNGFHFLPKRKQTKQEQIVTEKVVKESKSGGSKDKERIRSKLDDNRVSNLSRPKDPFPDYNQNDDWSNKIDYKDETSDFKREVREGPIGKIYMVHEPAPDYEKDNDEVDREMLQNKEITDTSTQSTREGKRFVQNGVRKEIIKGNTSNVKTTEQITQEKVVTRKVRSSSSEGKKSSKEEKVKKEKDKSKHKSGKKSQSEMISHHESKSERRINDRDAADKKFYYFGANEEITRPPRKKDKANLATSETAVTGLSSTKLVKEANAQVSGQEKYVASKSKSSDLRHVTESPTGSANQDSGYFSRGGMSPTCKDKLSSPEPFKERIINVQVEGRKGHRYQKSSNRREERITNGYYHDAEERMETSESDDIPNHWTAGGSRDSQASVPSNQWSSLEEDDEEIVAAHVNTPQSLIREMGKREISYENSQRPLEKDAELLWIDKSNVDADYRREMSTGCFTGGTAEPIQNDNHINNNWGGSATLSRLETNKNRMNNDTTMRSATVDRRQWNKSANENSGAVKVLLNGRDVTDSDTSTRHGILSKTSNYASETESQHSRGSKGSRKSGGSSPALKRVNFKTRSKTKRSASSAANLSPMHREAMLRAGSPVRPPSASESIHSSGSDRSNRSVIIHAPTVADIPPPSSYRYRIYRESTLSGSPPPPDPRGPNRSVTRTFSLLSPWKPKKYKNKADRHEGSDGSIRTSTPEKTMTSKNNSSEHLDSLSPLPSVKSKEKKSKKVVRTNSVPKDTRFASFFKRKQKENTEG